MQNLPQKGNFHLRHATIFGIGGMLIPVSGVLLLPLYVNYLTPEEFGTLEIVNRIANVLCICCLSAGVYHATGTFYLQAKDERQRSSIASTLLLFYLIGAVIGLVVLLPLTGVFSRFFGVDDFSLLLFAIGGNLVLSTLEIPYVLMRCRMESLGFVIVTFLQFLIRVFGTIVAVAWLGWGLWGVIGMYWISGVLFFGVLFLREFRLGTFWPDFSLFSPIARFAVPFLPGGLCTFIQMNADRFFLARYFDLDEVGLYALAAKLAGCVAMLSALPLQRVWLVRQYEVLTEPEGPQEAARWFTLITATQLAVGLGLSLFCRELLTLIGKEEYLRCATIVPVLVLAEYFLYANYVFEGPMFVYRKTLWKFYIGLITTVALLFLLFVFVPQYASIGAASATAAAYLFMCGASLWFSNRLRGISYDWKTVTLLLGLSILLYITADVATLQQHGGMPVWLRIVIKSGFLAVFLVAAAALRPWRLRS